MKSEQIQLAHGHRFTLGQQAHLMGILNITPDSFSDGGRYQTIEAACHQAQAMLEEGAVFIDIGGESTRPQAEPISSKCEQKRILPIIEALAGQKNMILSVDTYHPETARAAIKHGAHLINDICALQYDVQMAQIIAETSAGLILMHNGWQQESISGSLLQRQKVYFERALTIASQYGIQKNQILLDPGFGFGKSFDENLFLLKNFYQFRQQFADYPWLVGTSRKGFLGKIIHDETPENRDVVTAATSVLLRQQHADIFRVHNVKINNQALRILQNLDKFDG